MRTYLALDDPAELRPRAFSEPRAELARRTSCPVAEYREWYREVGAPWYWHDRLHWSDERLARHLALPTVAVWELRVAGEFAGYFELQRHDDASVEIVYFGLTPRFMNRRLGGAMLTRAVEEAFAMGARRVWLHTCTLDAPAALPSYEARGFRAYRTERLEVEIDGTAVVNERLLTP